MSSQDYLDRQARKLTNLFSGSEEAVGGTSTDDEGDERYEVLPDDVDPDSISDEQWAAIDAFLVEGDRNNPDFKELADGRGFSPNVARRIIHRVFRDTRDLRDIYPAHRLAVLIWSVHGVETSSTELEDKYPISSTVLKQARNIYPDLIEEVSGQITESDLDKYVIQYESTKPRSGASDSSSVRQKTADQMDYPEDFTPRMEWFIESIAEHPGESSGEISDRCDRGWHQQGYYEVAKTYPEIVANRIAEVGNAETLDDLHPWLRDRLGGLPQLKALAQNTVGDDSDRGQSDVSKDDIREYLEKNPDVNDVDTVLTDLGDPGISPNVVSGMMAIREPKQREQEPEKRKENTKPANTSLRHIFIQFPVEELYNLLTGGELSEETRRELFEQVVSESTERSKTPEGGS